MNVNVDLDLDGFVSLITGCCPSVRTIFCFLYYAWEKHRTRVEDNNIYITRKFSRSIHVFDVNQESKVVEILFRSCRRPVNVIDGGSSSQQSTAIGRPNRWRGT